MHVATSSSPREQRSHMTHVCFGFVFVFVLPNPSENKPDLATKSNRFFGVQGLGRRFRTTVARSTRVNFAFVFRFGDMFTCSGSGRAAAACWFARLG